MTTTFVRLFFKKSARYAVLQNFTLIPRASRKDAREGDLRHWEVAGGKTFLCPVSSRYIFLLALSRLSRSLEQTKASGIGRVGVSLIEVYGGVGKSVTSVRSP